MGTTTLLALPSELIEAILICSCSPRTVANVARTCRTLRDLIYASPDSHLWRELFLTTWDDPRPALAHRSLVDRRVFSGPLDWGCEYRRRVTAEKWLKAWRGDICLASDGEPEANTEKEDPYAPLKAEVKRYTVILSALFAALDTLLTLRPFPSAPIELTVLTPSLPPFLLATLAGGQTQGVGRGGSDRRERMMRAPQFPPVLIVLASGLESFRTSRSAVRIGRVVYGPHTSTSTARPKPIQVPTPSLPPQLVRTLLASHEIGVRGWPAHVPVLSGADHWGGDALADVFHRIVCITGFVPIPPPLESTSKPPPPSASTSPSMSTSTSVDVHVPMNTENELGTEEDGEHHCEHCGQGEPTRHTLKTFPTPSQQHADARRLARRRVYDMRYLRGDRLWGPFHPVTRESLGARPRAEADEANEKAVRASARGSASRRGMHQLATLAWAMGADVEPDDSDSTPDDSEDEDWRDPADAGRGSSIAGHAGGREQGTDNEDANSDEGMEAVEPEHPIISLILAQTEPTVDPHAISSSSRRTRRSNPRLPPIGLVSPHEIKSQHLRPDYTYLASVRIVVEENLRGLSRSEISDDMEGTASEDTPGGVDMFWEDEDEMMSAQAGGSGPASSSSHASLSTATTVPSNITNTTTFDHVDILSLFRNLNVARAGSACGYWGGWIEREQSAMRSADGDLNTSVSNPEDDVGVRKPRIVARLAELEKPIKDASTSKDKMKGKGKGKGDESAIVAAPGAELGDWEIGSEGEACEGWDWAGVAGIWRRCVCWMDYRELLFFNLDSTKFLTLDTQEACRIIPMEFWVTGYTRAGVMPVSDIELERSSINVFTSSTNRRPKKGYFRPPPVIHFSGNSVGSDRGSEDGRTVKGSVQLIGGGEVRWQMDTYTEGSDWRGSSVPEWTSEGVQVGGIGSAVGVFGMWTGATHERADPLGPFWAWKVA